MKYGVLSCLCRENDEVLMLRKNKRVDDPNSDFYALPGGKLEPQEKSNKFGRIFAAIREHWEETGLTLISPKFIGTILFDNPERQFDDWKNHDNYYVYVYSAKEFSGTLLEKIEEGFPLWVPKEKIFTLEEMNAGDKEMYKWIFDGRFFSGVIYHKGKELDMENTFVDFFTHT